MTVPTSQAAPQCQECGTPLANGACPACSLGFLLHGSVVDEAVAGAGVEEDVEFGRYTLKRRLAAGGMGVVYLADDRKLKRMVALKMIRGSTFADDGEVARFTIEAEAAAALDHPNIVPIYEVGRLDGQPFFTMKLIEGGTLAQRLKDHGGSLPSREVAVLLAKIARAVHHAHQRGVLHRDLKPGNILLDGAGEPWLTDFGLAKIAGTDSSLTLTRDHIGTPHYMAPEVAGGSGRAVSTASDVWALGVILWEMLCGMPPFHGPGPVEIMRRIVESEPSWPAGSRADGDLVTIARRCMEKNPARRPQSAGEVADELERWLRGEPIKARPVTYRERFVKWVRRKPALAALYAALAAGIATGVFLWQKAEGAVVSLTETNQRMEESLQIATATKLAGDALIQSGEDPGRALLLAVEAVKMTGARGVLPEAASALMNVLTKAGGLNAVPGDLQGDYQEGLVNFWEFHRRAAQISPDGRWLLSIREERWKPTPVPAAIYDLGDSVESKPLRQWEMWGGEGHIENAAHCWLPDSRRMLAVDYQGRVRIWPLINETVLNGHADPEKPEPLDLGLLPLSPELQMSGAKVWATAETMGVMWVERMPADWKVETGPPPVARLVKTQVAPDGLKKSISLKVDHEWANETGILATHLGDWALLKEAGGRKPLNLVDMSGDTPVSHTLDLPSHSGLLAEFTASGSHLAVHLGNGEIYHGALPAPGSASGAVKLRRIFHTPVSLVRLALSPDGQWLAATGKGSQVYILPLNEENPVPVPQFLTKGTGWGLNFSPDGKWLGASGTGRTIHLWRMDAIRSGMPPVLLHGMPSAVGELQFAPGNESVVAVGYGYVVRRWEFDGVSAGAMPRHVATGGLGVNDFSVSPDGEWVAAACDTLGDDRATGIDGPPVKAPLVISRLNGHSRLVLDHFGNRTSSAVFSRDGRWLAAAGRDTAVKVWDFSEAARAADAGLPPPAPKHVIRIPDIRQAFRWVLAFHPDGRLFMVNGDGLLLCWDVDASDPSATEQWELIHSIRYLLPDLAISPDGKRLAVARHGWDIKKDGQSQAGNQVLLFELGAKTDWPPKPVAQLAAYFLDFTQLAFSPDNRWLAAGSCGSPPCLWDLQAADIAASLRRPPVLASSITGVSFSPSSRELAIGAADGSLHFWDWTRPGEVRTVRNPIGLYCSTWLPDGRVVASGSSDQVTVWESDLSRLVDLAKNIAGRELSPEERERFRVPDRQ